MKREYFESLEQLPADSSLDLDEVFDQLAFNDQGLIPVITQDAETNEVLMFAWMNREALNRTLREQRMTYWSRSRNQFWVKGETSGHTQELVSMAIDCDGDVILCKARQSGAACHTGRKNCFYLEVDRDTNSIKINSDANLP